MTEDDQEPVEQDQGKRSRSRKSVIRRSEHHDEYRRLLEAGWSSLAMERYALFRYGEDIPSRTWREYRVRAGIKVETVPEMGPDYDPEQLIDVLAMQTDLARLQRSRIQIDVGHERSMNKLFSTTGREVQTLSMLLGEVKGTMQELGLLPGGKANTQVRGSEQEGRQVTAPAPKDARSQPPAKTLGELMPSMEVDTEWQLARMIADALPPPEQPPEPGMIVEGQVG